MRGAGSNRRLTTDYLWGVLFMQASDWSDEFLDTMRQTGDPPTDAAVAEIFALGQAARVNDLLREFDRNSEEVPADLPPLLREFFEHQSTLPAWADMQRIERGNDLIGRYAPQIISILHCYSLPLCYVDARASQVLLLSQRIHTQTFRRIMETAQFVLDVMDEGGLGPRGRGRRSAQKIRLLHATIRHHMQKYPDWIAAGLHEMPVNQEDLVSTMFTFSVALPRGLMKLGIELSKDDREALYHIWSVVGALLGTDERLIPRDFETAAAFSDRLITRLAAPSEAGRVITHALLDYMRQVVPAPGFEHAAPTLVRHFCGDTLADMVDVPKADWTRLGVTLASGLGNVFGKLTDKLPLAAKLASQVGILILKGGVLSTNGGTRYSWRVPASVNEHWR